MPDTILHHPGVASSVGWSGDITRVPFRVYRDRALVNTEQEQVFGRRKADSVRLEKQPEFSHLSHVELREGATADDTKPKRDESE